MDDEGRLPQFVKEDAQEEGGGSRWNSSVKGKWAEKLKQQPQFPLPPSIFHHSFSGASASFLCTSFISLFFFLFLSLSLSLSHSVFFLCHFRVNFLFNLQI